MLSFLLLLTCLLGYWMSVVVTATNLQNGTITNSTDGVNTTAVDDKQGLLDEMWSLQNGTITISTDGVNTTAVDDKRGLLDEMWSLQNGTITNSTGGVSTTAVDGKQGIHDGMWSLQNGTITNATGGVNTTAVDDKRGIHDGMWSLQNGTITYSTDGVNTTAVDDKPGKEDYFVIGTDAECYKSGDNVTVIVYVKSAAQNATFLGRFAILANFLDANLSAVDSCSVGTFDVSDNPSLLLKTCSNTSSENFVFGNVNASQSTCSSFVWIAPNDTKTDVVFEVVAIDDFENSVTSKPLTYNEHCPPQVNTKGCVKPKEENVFASAAPTFYSIMTTLTALSAASTFCEIL